MDLLFSHCTTDHAMPRCIGLQKKLEIIMEGNNLCFLLIPFEHAIAARKSWAWSIPKTSAGAFYYTLYLCRSRSSGGSRDIHWKFLQVLAQVCIFQLSNPSLKREMWLLMDLITKKTCAKMYKSIHFWNQKNQMDPMVATDFCKIMRFSRNSSVTMVTIEFFLDSITKIWFY